MCHSLRLLTTPLRLRTKKILDANPGLELSLPKSSAEKVAIIGSGALPSDALEVTTVYGLGGQIIPKDKCLADTKKDIIQCDKSDSAIASDAASTTQKYCRRLMVAMGTWREGAWEQIMIPTTAIFSVLEAFASEALYQTSTTSEHSSVTSSMSSTAPATHSAVQSSHSAVSSAAHHSRTPSDSDLESPSLNATWMKKVAVPAEVHPKWMDIHLPGLLEKLQEAKDMDHEDRQERGETDTHVSHNGRDLAMRLYEHATTLFSELVNPEASRLPINIDAKIRSRRSGYVEFKNEESVPAAIQLIGQQLLGIPIIAQLTEAEKNRQARTTGEGGTATNGVPFHRLYVGNIHFSITESDLDLGLKKQMKSRPDVPQVEFKNEESVPAAIQLTGQQLLGIPIIAQLTEAEKNRQARTTGEGGTATNGVPFHRLYVGNIHFSITKSDLDLGLTSPKKTPKSGETTVEPIRTTKKTTEEFKEKTLWIGVYAYCTAIIHDGYLSTPDELDTAYPSRIEASLHHPAMHPLHETAEGEKRRSGLKNWANKLQSTNGNHVSCHLL
ncbi:hypothetical protein K490DRAFT_68821 [Saccharata proteae CBS 121410]|uniref:RRM domain-containing protein n=1 Tax=Saccharata proteae CBS 121410 TaxID=1314787 RepID=A0A9P4HPM2_9PEZI|nr:hypothetical protein K490DRAFT_68821 [Saccharata proteae CBS 121410]